MIIGNQKKTTSGVNCNVNMNDALMVKQITRIFSVLLLNKYTCKRFTLYSHQLFGNLTLCYIPMQCIVLY